VATQVAKRSYLIRSDSVIRENWKTDCPNAVGRTSLWAGAGDKVRFVGACGWEPSVRKLRLRAASLSQLKLLEYVGTFLVLDA
jgi:hypothetical protein